MKTKYFFHGAMMVAMMAVALVMGSCAKSEQTTEQVKLAIAIPENAPVVWALDMQSLAEKSDAINKIDEIIAMADDESMKESAAAAFLLRSELPLGLNFEQPVYLFFDKNFKGLYGIISVKDAKEFQNKCNTYAEGKLLFEEKDGFTWLKTEKELIGVLSDEYLLIGSLLDKKHTAAEQKTALEDVMKEGDYLTTEAGKFLIEHKGDITANVNFQSFPKNVMDALKKEVKKTNGEAVADQVIESLKKAQIAANIQFLEGAVDLNLYTTGFAQNQYSEIYQPITEETFAHIPNKDMVGLLALGLKGEEFGDAIMEEMDKSGSLGAEDKMGVAIIINMFKEMNGTVVASVALENKYADPEVVAVLPMAKSNLNLLKSEIENANIQLLGDNQFTVLTNSYSYRYGKAGAPFDKVANALGSYAYLYLDLQRIIALAYKDEAWLGGEEEAEYNRTMRQLFNLMDYIEMRSNDMNAVKISLLLTDDSRNSLDLFMMRLIEFAKAEEAYEAAKEEYMEYVYASLEEKQNSEENIKALMTDKEIDEEALERNLQLLLEEYEAKHE